MTVAYAQDFSSAHFKNVPSPPDGPDAWHAFLKLHIEKRGEKKQKSALTRVRHRGPLCIQKPFYPEGEDLAHLYILHPPGGIVSGDVLTIAADIQPHARALLTAPGAGRVYRARASGKTQTQHVAIQVGNHASAEWLPQENILYPGARSAMHTRIQLAEHSQFIGWDITSFGLPAQEALFVEGEFTQKFEIWQGNRPCFAERFSINNHNRHLMQSRAGLQGHAMQGLFVAGPFAFDESAQEPELMACMTTCREHAAAAQAREAEYNRRLLTGTTRVDKFIVARALGDCSEAIKNLFIRHWHCFRPQLLQRPACSPRIWAT